MCVCSIVHSERNFYNRPALVIEQKEVAFTFQAVLTVIIQLVESTFSLSRSILDNISSFCLDIFIWVFCKLFEIQHFQDGNTSQLSHTPLCLPSQYVVLLSTEVPDQNLGRLHFFFFLIPTFKSYWFCLHDTQQVCLSSHTFLASTLVWHLLTLFEGLLFVLCFHSCLHLSLISKPQIQWYHSPP